MTEQPNIAGKSYQIGDVGAGARVAQGEHITWTEGFAGNPQSEELKRQFTDLLTRIDNTTDLNEDERASFIAHSVASEPVVRRKTLSRPLGARPSKYSAS